MNKFAFGKAGVVLLLLLFAFPALADQVVLTNGDTLTGTVVKKAGDKLTFKTALFGEVEIPWSAVQSLTTTENLTVVLPGGEAVTGTVTTAGNQVEVATPEGRKAVPLPEVSAVRNATAQLEWERLQHPGLLELWTGFVDMGFALARGNARTDTLTTSFNATRITPRDKVSAFFNQIYGTARLNGQTSAIASALRGGWNYNRNLSPRLFVAVMNEYDHDRFLDLDLRFVAGGGLGVNVIKRDDAALSFTGAMDYSRENFSSGISRNSAEANFGNDLMLKLGGSTTITQAWRLFPNLSDTGEYRMAADLSVVTAVNKWLGWHVTASDRFLTNPVLGRQRNDLLLSTGLRVSFAH